MLCAFALNICQSCQVAKAPRSYRGIHRFESYLWYYAGIAKGLGSRFVIYLRGFDSLYQLLYWVDIP